MLAVGLTGGIASGKSTVANGFENRGVPVLDADAAARDVVAPGTPGLQAVVDQFGEDILDASGGLDRAAMRKRVFGDSDARRALETIIHPAVRLAMGQWLAAQTTPYAMLMIPLLVESKLTAIVGKIVVVDVPLAVQRQRLVARDDIDAALADQMIAAQATRDQRLAVADHVIDNGGDIEALPSQIDTVHQALSAAAKATAGSDSLQSANDRAKP